MYAVIFAKHESPLEMWEGFQLLGDGTMDLAISILLYLGYSVIIVKEITHEN
jgi:hypothetical protein